MPTYIKSFSLTNQTYFPVLWSKRQGKAIENSNGFFCYPLVKENWASWGWQIQTFSVSIIGTRKEKFIERVIFLNKKIHNKWSRYAKLHRWQHEGGKCGSIWLSIKYLAWSILTYWMKCLYTTINKCINKIFMVV